jgi:hypothetical protein
MRGIFLTLGHLSFSTLDTLAELELLLDFVPVCHSGSLLSGMLLG